MKAVRAMSVLWVATVLATSAFAQDRTLARLAHETAPEVTHPRVDVRGDSSATTVSRSETLSESEASRAAATALFVNGDLMRAHQLAERAWRRDHRDAEALFVQMEVAAMQADELTKLNAAVNLCAMGSAAKQDPRIEVAVARVRESAANTPEFRAVVPRLQSVLANSREDWPELSGALLGAALDGVAGLDAEVLARASGILTQWRIVGPLGRHPLLDFDQISISPNDDLSQPQYESHAVENFEFPDGLIYLPHYLPRRGTFYAEAQFASLTPGTWMVRAESAGLLEVFLDGDRVLRQGGSLHETGLSDFASVEVAAGPHRVLLKFAGTAVPIKIAVLPATPKIIAPLKAHRSAQELTYELASAAYSKEAYGMAIQQIGSVHSAAGSVALHFVLAESWARQNPAAPEGLAAWNRLLVLAPGALSADRGLAERALAVGHGTDAVRFARRVLETRPNDVRALETLGRAIQNDPSLANSAQESAQIWSRRLAQHPSCEVSQQAMMFYHSQQQVAQAAAAQRKLDGCAPESLAYAQSLASEGHHDDAVQALEQLLAAAPLSRAARLLLIRELQFAGDDSGAERAAAAWMRIAPNASQYRRLAAAENPDDPAESAKEFYTAYRRDAAQLINAAPQVAGPPVVLLNDHVAIARPDGSVSLYVHTVTRFTNPEDIAHFGTPDLPDGAQTLQMQTLHSDGSVAPVDPRNSLDGASALAPGDAIDEEYVINYGGDGGISEHPEVFQFVFGSFNEKVLRERFVVLTPATQADRAVVIASSTAPLPVSRVEDTVLARIWERDEVSVTTGGLTLLGKSLPIVRVVEQENGWTVPADAEHRRRIETVHPGPRFEEAKAKVEPAIPSSGTSKL